jgi:ABC-type lipoprotein release transport system permease subunit
MWQDYFKIAWRNLIKSRTSSIINISGLAVGIAVAMLTGLWLHDELSFNTWHENYDRIAKVSIKGTGPNGPFISSTLSCPLANTLIEQYKDDFQRLVRSTAIGESILSAGEKKMSCSGQYMDEPAPDMFTLKMLRGSRTGLADPHSILLSQAVSRALFGDSDPINRTILINNETVVKVTGVYQDLPLNTDLHNMQFISPFKLWVSENTWAENTDWVNHFMKLFAEIKPGTSFGDVDRQIGSVETDHIKNVDNPNYKGEMSIHPQIMLYPMAKWHLEGADRRRNPGGASEQMVWLVSLIGGFVLLLACINFMNLSTARSEKRAREVGIRKAIGSLRGQLIGQFFGESLVVVLVSFIVALGLTKASLDWFNQLAAKQMDIPWANPWFWAVSAAFVVITGVVAGSYPALYLSSFKPVKALKGAACLGRASVIPRKALVVFQFTISVALINCTIIVLRQVQCAKDRPVGYSRDGLIMVNMRSGDFYGKETLIRNELLKTGAVESFSESMGKVTELASGNGGFDWLGRDIKKDENYGTLAVSADYGRTVAWQVVQGRDFNRESPLDSSGLIINETAMKEMGLKDPIGTEVTWTWWMDRSQVLRYRIFGVVKDLVLESPYSPTGPVLYYEKGLNGGVSWMEIKVRPGVAMSRALPKIEAVFKELIPSAPFDYQFADEAYAVKFASEVRMSKLAGFFAALAIFISCLGLFGLASFTAEQRTREVGIRKVLGASVFKVWRLLSKEFVWLVTLSLVIAMPVAYYFMDHWLMHYQYRIGISGWIFAASGIGALGISLITVSFQAIRAAVANPVKSLRTE